MLVAFTEKLALSRVYGNVASRVIAIDVLSVGFAEVGVIERPDLVAAIMVRESAWVTVCPLITMVMVTVAPADKAVSKGDIKHTNVVDVEV